MNYTSILYRIDEHAKSGNKHAKNHNLNPAKSWKDGEKGKQIMPWILVLSSGKQPLMPVTLLK